MIILIREQYPSSLDAQENDSCYLSMPGISGIGVEIGSSLVVSHRFIKLYLL
jgi:hypothetical protein